MNKLKKTRLNDREVKCHPGTMVGEYVPFYFAPRSVMLYLLHRGNHLEVDYSGGQRPLVHLEADLRATVTWANQQVHRRRWRCRSWARHPR